MSTNHEAASESDGWEAAGRTLLQQQVEFVDQDLSDALRPLRRAALEGGDVPAGTASELRSVMLRLETLAEIADTLDPAVADHEDAEARLGDDEISADR